MALYPITVNMDGQLCVVIGGGTVAARKLYGLLACGAKVRLVSPKILPQIHEIVQARKVEWLPRVYVQGDLKGAAFVFALTNCPETQMRIIEDARLLAIPVNVADNPDASTFHVPATLRRGDFLISVSTGGGSPSLAAAVRIELENQYGPEYGELVTLLSAIRRQVMQTRKRTESRKRGETVDTHKDIFADIDCANLLSLLRQKDWSVLGLKLREILPSEIEVDDIVSKVQAV
jgi:precorrin-2 dehydrogenase/sirohydrochlorin ferrochelatase